MYHLDLPDNISERHPQATSLVLSTTRIKRGIIDNEELRTERGFRRKKPRDLEEILSDKSPYFLRRIFIAFVTKGRISL